MSDSYFDLAWGILGLVGMIIAVLFIVWWRNKTADGVTPLQGRRVEAEILDVPMAAPAERRCRACGAASSPVGWRRPSSIAVMGGPLGWSRRVRGLPPLYTRLRPAFGVEDLCAECSHVRDTKIDKKIMEANLALHTIGEQIALEVQRFAVSLDDDMKESVAASDSRKRLRSVNPPRP